MKISPFRKDAAIVDKLIIKPKESKSYQGYTTFSIRIKRELLEQINAICISTKRSRNEIVTILLEFALEHFDR